MNWKSLKWTLFFITVSLFSGCARQAIQSDNYFWSHSNANILIVQHTLPDGGEYILEGSQALLDAAYDQPLTKQIISHLSNQKADSFLTIDESFQNLLEAENYKVTLYPELINFKQLAEFKRGRNTFDYRLTDLFESSVADYILINQLEIYGAFRSYYGVRLRNPPSGYAVAYSWLIDRNHKIVWYSGDSIGTVKVFAPRPWDQPPDFPNLSNWMQRSIYQSQETLIQSLMNQFRPDIPLR